MKILLTGATGGIGSAIKEALKEHEVATMGRPDMFMISEQFDWVIFAHGIIDEQDIEGTFEANTFSCIKLTEDLVSDVTEGIIFISSTAAIHGNDTFPVYAASKAAINNYTKSLARKHKDISFYALCPGPTNTKMWRDLGLDGEAQDPSEVAKAVKWIMDGEFISGDVITVRSGEINKVWL